MHYIPVATPPPPQTTAIFRDFKKSTAMCKVHNVGLRYIKNQRGEGDAWSLEEEKYGGGAEKNEKTRDGIQGRANPMFTVS